MDQIGTNLTHGVYLDKLRGILAPKLNILDISKDEMTKANVEPFQIDLLNTTPSFERPLRYNPTLTKFIDKEVNTLLKKGLIYLIDSTWAAKAILAPKGETQRICLNYVGLNAKTRPNQYPLPNIEDMYTKLRWKRVYFVLDLLSRYWQVPIAIASQMLTTFITLSGLYAFRVLPFGLRNAPSHFQRILNDILRPLLRWCCLVYIDDIIVFSDNDKQHLEHLSLVMERLIFKQIWLSPNSFANRSNFQEWS